MNIPFFNSRLLARKHVERLFLDLADYALREVTGRGDWPPYSLRSFVGGAWDFDRVGTAFVDEFWRLGLLRPEIRILDIGCGCGRIARALATDRRLQELRFSYTGMDIDRDNIEWCQRHITPANKRFSFYRADYFNLSYNPRGTMLVSDYAFPHPDASFDLILLTSVMTHLLEEDVYHYLAEVNRMLAPGGTVYATFFLYESLDDAIGSARRSIRFPFERGNYSISREDCPTDAVAYRECYISRVIGELGFEMIGPILYGLQDVLILAKTPGTWPQSQLVQGWHELENGSWRWTEEAFSVHLLCAAPAHATLRFRFYLPPLLMEEHKQVHLSAKIEGVPLPRTEYTTAGDQLYSCEIPECGCMDGNVLLQFQLDKARRPSPADWRELGLIVVFEEPSPLKRLFEPFMICPA